MAVSPQTIYPKHPRDIRIRIIRRDLEDGLLTGQKTEGESSLSDKMDEYLLRLGYSNADAQTITVELLTKGKVRVDFRNYTERLELIDPKDLLIPSAAISLFDDFIKEIEIKRQLSSQDMSMTRVFRVQRPPNTKIK
jgi:hypothetical protein